MQYAVIVQFLIANLIVHSPGHSTFLDFFPLSQRWLIKCVPISQLFSKEWQKVTPYVDRGMFLLEQKEWLALSEKVTPFYRFLCRVNKSLLGSGGCKCYKVKELELNRRLQISWIKCQSWICTALAKVGLQEQMPIFHSLLPLCDGWRQDLPTISTPPRVGTSTF